jgi:hypothetical protein
MHRPNSASFFEDGSDASLLTPEKREIKCEKCEKCFCAAVDKRQLLNLPRELLLHLERFIGDVVSPDYSSITYRKNKSAAAFADKLLLEKHGILNDFMATYYLLAQQVASCALRSAVNHIIGSLDEAAAPDVDLSGSRKCQLYC